MTTESGGIKIEPGTVCHHGVAGFQKIISLDCDTGPGENERIKTQISGIRDVNTPGILFQRRKEEYVRGIDF